MCCEQAIRCALPCMTYAEILSNWPTQCELLAATCTWKCMYKCTGSQTKTVPNSNDNDSRNESRFSRPLGSFIAARASQRSWANGQLANNELKSPNIIGLLLSHPASAHITRSSAIAEGPRGASCQLKSCQLPRNSAETTCTTSPEPSISCR